MEDRRPRRSGLVSGPQAQHIKIPDEKTEYYAPIFLEAAIFCGNRKISRMNTQRPYQIFSKKHCN
jgi:hypothetical protein